MLIFHLDFNFVNLRYEFVRELMARVAALGYDAILWELENQVAWESCPECADEGAWTKAQFHELLDYSRALGLEPIPLLQTIGHAEYVLSHPKYHSFREHPGYSDCYCVSNPSVRPFLQRWIAEYCEMFSGLKYFHLGGDEAYRFGSCRNCSVRDRHALYGEHIDALAADLKARNIRPGIWGDMILEDADKLDSISRDVVIWDWNYATGIGTPKTVRVWGVGEVSKETVTPELRKRFPELLASSGELNPFYTADALQNRGHDVILCSAARSSCDGPFCPNTGIHAPNIAGAAAKCRDSRLSGHCVTSWAIRLNPLMAGLPLLDLPAVAAAAPDAGLEAWRRQTGRRHFGFEAGLDAADQLSCCDGRLRSFSAVQWSGLKDSRPVPPGFLAGQIRRWIAEREPWWLEREAMLACMRASTQQGLSMLEPYAAQWATAALWTRAGRLQLEYLDLLQNLFTPMTPPSPLRQRLQDFKVEVEAYFECEQTPDSARKNAGLVVDPLLDYQKNIGFGC